MDGLEAPDHAWVTFGLAPRQMIGGEADVVDQPRPVQADNGSRVRPEAATEDDVHRREVLRFGGAALGAAVDGKRDLVSFMVAPPGRTADRPLDVTKLAKQVRAAWRLRQRADYEALGRLLPALLGNAEDGMSNADDPVRVHYGRALVHAYNAASSLLKKLGDEPLALLAADRGLRSARPLGDPVLTAAAKYRLANVLLAAQRLDEARTVALGAADLADPGRVRTPRSLAVWGGLLLTAAVAAARRGDESDAWELIGQARTASRLLGRDYADIYSIFGPTNVAIHGVQVAAELKDGLGTVRRSQRVDADRLPSSLLERRSQLMIDTAHGHVLQCNDGEAVAALLRAEDIAPQEVRLSREVRDLTETMLGRERVGAVPGLRDLAARVGAGD